MAEWLITDQPELAELHGLDPEIAEAAALAHDLGHPPFGHIAEEALDTAVKEAGVLDGFEGNPQTFRILTKLARRHLDFEGLNLTRATLNAVLKYPWFRQTGGSWKQRKWGAFHTEEEDFSFARQDHGSDDWKSAEAEVMDWADDIAYAVHDLEDFYRGGLVPLDRILRDEDDAQLFIDKVFKRWEEEKAEPFDKEGLTRAFRRVIDVIRRPLLSVPYQGTLEQRAALRSVTSLLIGRYATGLQLKAITTEDPKRVVRDPGLDMEIKMLKQLTMEYVIRNPALTAQQYGEKRVVTELFGIFLEAAKGDRGILPISARERLNVIDKGSGPRDSEYVRVAADLVAGMTEDQALRMHGRLTGSRLGSVVETFVR